MENDIPVRILHLSDECLVFNKKSGEAVEGARAGTIDLPRLLAAALSVHEPLPDMLPLPAAAHRLDIPVSGCVVFARTRRALNCLNAAFAEEPADTGVAAVEKIYWAVVEAPDDMPPEHGTLVHWIQVDSRKNKSRAYTEPGPGRKKALLHYRLAGVGRNYLFLEIQLFSGRHHQIRAQLEQAGLHIKGDLKYGARRSEKNGGIRLHARSLSFPDPGIGTAADVVADVHISARLCACADPPLRDNLWLDAAACFTRPDTVS